MDSKHKDMKVDAEWDKFLQSLEGEAGHKKISEGQQGFLWGMIVGWISVLAPILYLGWGV